jgi:hypothetical protein
MQKFKSKKKPKKNLKEHLDVFRHTMQYLTVMFMCSEMMPYKIYWKIIIISKKFMYALRVQKFQVTSTMHNS